MKIYLFILFCLSFSVLAQTSTPIIGSAVSNMGTPMVHKYAKPQLPPEQTEEEEKAEDPTRQAVKGAATAGGILVGSNLVLKGFSTKYAKEGCLAKNNMRYWGTKSDEGRYVYKNKDKEVVDGVNQYHYHIWDTSFAFDDLKKNETQKCLLCCSEYGNVEGKSAEEIKIDKEKRDQDIEDCNEKKDEDEKEKCLEEFKIETTDCVSNKLCNENTFIQQMNKHCKKKRFRDSEPCTDKKL